MSLEQNKTYTEDAFDKIFEEKDILEYKFDGKNMGRRDQKTLALLNSYAVKGKSCLDIGPGTGRWLQYFKKNEAQYIGALDISDRAIERCAPFCDKIQKGNIEFEKLEFDDDTFDVAISFMVLEHIVNPENYFTEIKRVCKNGANVLISIPNIVSFKSRIRVLFGVMPTAVTSDKTHVRFYTEKELKKILSKFGLSPKMIPTSFSLNPFWRPRMRLPTNQLTKSWDDHLLFSIEIKK